MGSVGQKPKGEDQVRDALVDAAMESYGEGAFSVRKIARRAGVNHGQIHHYFGGMPGLKRAMLERLGALQDEQIAFEAPADVVALLSLAARISVDDKRMVRALARRILEDPDDGDFQLRFPVVSRLQAAMRETLGQDADPVLAHGLARALGWSLFGGWITQAVGLSDEAVCEVEQSLATVPQVSLS